MAAPRAVAISGSPRSPSKSKALAEMLLAQLASSGYDTEVIDVATLPAEALLARAGDAALDAAIAAVGGARIVIAASPTYRALYTGALKCFFDLMAPNHLLGKVCVPVLTAGAPAHFLAIDHGFGPLFASLEGTIAPGLFAVDDQFADGVPSAKLRARVEHVAEVAVRMAAAMEPA
jgi:FMN reductase